MTDRTCYENCVYNNITADELFNSIIDGEVIDRENTTKGWIKYYCQLYIINNNISYYDFNNTLNNFITEGQVQSNTKRQRTNF